MGNTYYYEDALGTGAVILVLVLYLLLLGIGIASYVLQGIGLYDLGKKRQLKNPWLAWIPAANLWALGAVVDSYAAQHGIKRRWRWLMLIFLGIAIVCYVLLFAVMFSTIFMMELRGTVPDPTVIWGMVGGIFAVYLPLILSTMALGVCQIVCMYKAFEETVPEKAVKYMLLSVLVPLAYGICLIRCARQAQPVAEERPALPEEGGFVPQDPFAGLDDNETN